MILDLWFHLLQAMLAVNLIKGLAVLAAVFALTGIVRKLSAETRHVLWFSAICLFLALPIAWLVVPSVQVGTLIPEGPLANYRVALAPVLSRGEYIELVEKGLTFEALGNPGVEAGVDRIWLLLVLAWLVGVLFLSSRLVVGRWKLKRLAAAACSNGKVQAVLARQAREMGLRARIPVFLSPRCTIPFTFGCWRPAIFMPSTATSWTVRELRSAFVHELGHIKRRDVLIQSIAYLVCVLYWFIAPIWLAYTAMVREAETCCDRFVINRGIRRTQYARYIIDLAGKSGGRLLLPSISSTLGRNGMLKQRVKKVLSLQPGGVSPGIRNTGRVAAVCLVCLLPLLALTCATKPMVVQADDPLYGTWINPEYGGMRYDMIEKWEIYPEGRELRYISASDELPICEIRNRVIDELWIDAEGNRWYRGHFSQCTYPYREDAAHVVYWFRKISVSGTTLEYVGRAGDYPVEMSRIAGQHFIHYRQQ